MKRYHIICLLSLLAACSTYEASKSGLRGIDEVKSMTRLNASTVRVTCNDGKQHLASNDEVAAGHVCFQWDAVRSLYHHGNPNHCTSKQCVLVDHQTNLYWTKSNHCNLDTLELKWRKPKNSELALAEDHSLSFLYKQYKNFQGQQYCVAVPVKTGITFRAEKVVETEGQVTLRLKVADPVIRKGVASLKIYRKFIGDTKEPVLMYAADRITKADMVFNDIIDSTFHKAYYRAFIVDQYNREIQLKASAYFVNRYMAMYTEVGFSGYELSAPYYGHPNNFDSGVAGADYRCQENLNRSYQVDRWIAVLSDSTTNFADRADLSKPLYFRKGHFGSIQQFLSAKRQRVSLDIVNAASPGYFWSATSKDGTFNDDYVSCNQWGSQPNLGESKGISGELRNTYLDLTGWRKSDCGKRQRLLCVGLVRN